MAQLDSRKRAELRDSDFAYVDARGRRRLPIHDEAHVRNALARFNQVVFDDEASRATARTRLLKAAKRHGIVPIGFMEGQLRATGPRSLPTGHVTFLLSDIVDSTGLLQQLGDGYAKVLADVRRHIRSAVRRTGGREVDARADEFLAVFTDAGAAVTAALTIQSGMHDHPWPDGAAVRVRVGLHSGRPTLTDAGYVGLVVHALNRICAVAGAGKIVASAAVLAAVGERWPAEAASRELGPTPLRGVREAVVLHEVSVA
ncbi:MAG TPA: adenylate/guanylate cyclase domain-containing protein [Candidatus Limnocylindria bacterium]